MLNLKWVSLFIVVLLLGCSSTPIIIEREVQVPVLVPAVSDTVTLVDSVSVIDTLWYGKIKDSLDSVIGDILVDCDKKIAAVKIYSRIDTIEVAYPDTQWVKTTDPIENIVLRVIGSLMNALPFWQNLIIIVILMGTVIIIIKIKKD